MTKKSLLNAEVIAKLASVSESRARDFAPTKRLKEGRVIQSSVVRHRDGTVSIKMWADLQAAPEARAYEFGSGIHRPPGRKRSKNQTANGTILIRPKNKKFLAFVWDTISLKEKRHTRIMHFKKNPDWRERTDIERFPSYAGELPDGRSLFNYVHHPGVRAANDGRGYLNYGASVALADMLPELSFSVVRSISQRIRVSFAKRKGVK